MDKIFYNQASSAKLGWDPTWFGAKEFDEELIKKITDWQRGIGLKADGLCGPATYRRVYTERLSNITDYAPPAISCSDEAYIVCQGNFHKINWPKVVLWSDENGLKSSGGFTPYFEKRDVKMFVNHWDVCLSAHSCAKVLNKRGISVHFCIDNDGTIYQMVDMNHAAWHAGSSKCNRASVGVEISNAYYPKYQGWYESNGFGKRPLVEDAHVHGRSMKPFMDFYPVQIEALKALWEACHNALDIPYKCPTDKNGETLYKTSSSAAAARFKGFVSHYHLTNRKIDCANLDINKLLKELK